MKISTLINDLKSKQITLYCDQGNIKIIGPKKEITNNLKENLKKYKSDIIEYLNRNNIPRIKETNDGCYSLSSAQKRMYVLNNLNQNSTSYNIPFVMKISGDLDLERVENSFKELIKRHEALRTFFITINSQVYQKLEKDIEFKINYTEIQEQDIDNKIKNFIRPFDFKKAPLMRVEICKVNKNEYYMMIDMHHIITDGTSMKIFVDEFSKIYANKVLEELDIQYKDFSAWQEELFCSDKLIKEEEYWINVFKEAVVPLDLVTDFIRPKLKSYEGNKMDFPIDNELTKKLKLIARENEVTLFMLLLSIYTVFLSRYTNQEDIVVGTPIEGRNNNALKNIMGIFVNTLPIRVKPKKNINFIDYLKEIRANTLKAYENQNYQFDRLIEKLDLDNDTSRSVLFDTMFDLQNTQDIKFKIEDLNFEAYNITNNISKFDLSLSAIEHDASIHFNFEYCTKLFNENTIRNMGNKFISVLEQICNNTTIKLSQINMVSKYEKDTILYEFNNANTKFEGKIELNQIFENSVERTPNNIAVVFENEKLTYYQLNQKANKLARLLREKGIKENDIVGILVERSLDMIIGLLAILKSGAAYLPIDPEYPKERIDYMISDSKAKLIITQEKLKEKVDKYNFVMFNDKLIKDFDDNNLNCKIRLDDLAYVIYTSGTTGNPKGVMITHNNVANYIIAFLNKIDLTQDDSILQVVSFAFDAFTEEIYPILSRSGKIVISKELKEIGIDGIVQNINEHDITIMSCSPLLLNEIDKNKNLNNNRKMKFISGGDILKYDYIKNIIKFSDVYNSYGPTETTVCATYYKLKQGDKNRISIPIGKPLSNYTVLILDEENNLLPIGMPGELCISGDGLSRGYLNNIELTNEKFKMDQKYGKIYRTGDLAKWLSDGNIEYIGRIDNQVKIRGYRIELQEIEYKLLSYDAISDAIVIVKKSKNGDKYIVAYVCSQDLDTKVIREKLANELPSYMVPSYIISIEEIPRTINGKINKKGLPEPNLEYNSNQELELPENIVEEKLVKIWKEILGMKNVGVNNNFFEVGGHSLKALTLISQIYEILNVELNLSDIFNNPTIRGIAQEILIKEKRSYISIKKTEIKEFYNVSSAQKRLYLLNSLDKESIAYNMPFAIKINGDVDFNKYERALKKLIDRHESLRTSFFMQDGELVQRIEKNIDFNIKYYSEVDCSIDEIMNNFIKPFSLEKAPLLRVEIISIRDKEYIMLIDIHHIICDGLSIDTFIQELIKLYKGEQLENLNIQYKDYSEWKSEFENSEIYKNQENYWLNLFNGEIPILNMPTDYKRNKVQNFEGDLIYFKADNSLSSSLNNIAMKNGVTMNMLLLAAYTILLNKYTAQNDIIVGMPIIGRSHKDLNNVIGMFVNTLPIRNYVDLDKNFQTYLKEVKQNSLKAYENQDYDFYDLIEKLNIKRSVDRNPLFETTFNMNNSSDINMNIEDIIFQTYPIDFNISKFDFNLSAVEQGNEIQFMLRYCTKLFKKETMERLSSHFINILTQIAKDQKIKLADIEVISSYEKNKIVYDFNNTAFDYPNYKTIHELFEEQVEKTPNNIAVSYKGKQLTFKELNEKANSLARILRNSGIGANDIVGIMVKRSIEMIVAIIAILKAGGAYLPIDPSYPEERIDYILKNSRAKLLLTENKFKSKISFESNIYDLNNEELYKEINTNLERNLNENDLAYIIYTSGTTGQPKGVMVEHSNVINLVYALKSSIYYKYDYRLKVALVASFVFDASVQQIFGTLLLGNSLYILPEEDRLEGDKLIKFYSDNEIDVTDGTPMHLAMIANSDLLGKVNLNLKHLIIGGDQLAKNIVEKIYDKVQNKEIIITNVYGPTECCVDATYENITSNNISSFFDIAVGKPLNNYKIYILSNDKICPIGVPGELSISGDGLSRGYLNNEKLTNEKFVNNPYEPGKKMYKTGDLAKWLPNGSIELLGRIDDQVKIRGYRIEVKEIELQLLKNSKVKETAVIVRKDKDNNKYLCAYIVLKEEYMNISTSELREFVSTKIPSYMIPAHFVKLDKLPLTTNGKLDKNLLPEPNRILEMHSNYRAPRNEIENKLVEVWEDVLDVKGISINTNFFETGGDSIKALQIVSALNKHNLKLEIKDIFDKLKIKDISKYVKVQASKLRNNDIVEGSVELTPIQREYFEKNKEELSHYVQSFMLYRKEGFNEIFVREIFNKIIEQHDALRMRYTMENGEIIQYNRRLENNIFDLCVQNLNNERDIEEKIYMHSTKIKEEMSLEDGKLIKLCIFKTCKGDYLLIVIHHLIIDGVSWRILFDDIETLYKQAVQGEELDLGYKLSSYKEFASKINKYAASDSLLKEKAYWTEISKSKVKYINRNNILDPGHEKDSETLSVFLDKTQTYKLLKETNKAYNTQINDILLTALILTTRVLTGENKLKVIMEGHGREDIFEDIDISRTVGWFTSIYPVYIDLGNEMEISKNIKMVKESLRKIPNKGIGYGILKYMSNDISFRNKENEEILFNYLGEIDNNLNGDQFDISKFNTGKNIGDNIIRTTSLEMNLILINGQLIISTTFNSKQYDNLIINELNERYKENLERIINHCCNKDQIEKTASDYGYGEISVDDLADLLKEYEYN